MIGKILKVVAAVATVGAMTAGQAWADRLDDIKARGKLIVAVADDFKPWGYRNEEGELKGLEIDLAKDLAKRLGVELQLVPLAGAFKRMQAVYTGEVDVAIAGIGDNPKRREQVGFVEPHYYTSGYGVLARRSLGLKDWVDLKGKKICSVENSWYDKFLTGTYGAELVPVKNYNGGLDAAQAGRCDGVAYDNTWNTSTRKSGPERWAEFEQPLATQGKAPWGMVIDKKEGGTGWGSYLTAVAVDWHKSGFLVELEGMYDIKPEPWLVEQKAKYQVG